MSKTTFLSRIPSDDTSPHIRTFMNKLLVSSALLATVLAVPLPALADHDDNSRSENPFTLAVYGDAPYGSKPPSAAAAPDECPAGSGFFPDSPNGPNPGDPRQL